MVAEHLQRHRLLRRERMARGHRTRRSRISTGPFAMPSKGYEAISTSIVPSRRLDRVPASGASCTCTSQSGWRSVNRETARSSNGAVDTGTIIDLIKGEPVDWQQVVGSGVFTVLTGPVPRFGARGTATSIYVSDPDGNTIELRCYPADA